MVLGNLGLSQEVAAEDALELTTGVHVRSVLELLEALKTMSEEDYSHHIGAHYNDFAEWIVEHYHDDLLHTKIVGAKNRAAMIRLLEGELKKELRTFTKKSVPKKENKHKITAPKRKKEVLRALGGEDG